MKTISSIIFFSVIYFTFPSLVFCQVVQEWEAIYDGLGDDRNTSLAIDDSCNVFVTGTSPVNYEAENFCTIKYNNYGSLKWIRYYNGPAYASIDEAKCIATDHSGNVYVAGNSADLSRDYVTIKYNLNGDIRWVARYDGPGYGYDNPVAIIVDEDENVYVTGHSMGSGTNFDCATIKYDSTGTELWVERYNGPANSADYSYALALDDSGNVFITGYSMGPNEVNADCITIKYNSAGVEQWVARYDSPAHADDNAEKIAVDSFGNSYITGKSRTSTIVSNSGYLTIKYNSDGIEQWVNRAIGPLGSDGARDIVLDHSGNLFVTGTSYNNQSNYDYTTIKYNSNGVQQWVNFYNGPAGAVDAAHSIAIDKSGSVYITGSSTGSGTNSDFATIKYSNDGDEQWVVRYNRLTTSLENAFDIAVDDNYNLYVTGDCVTNNYDYATIKYSQSITGISMQETTVPEKFLLNQNTPNPFNAKTNISWHSPLSCHQTLKIYNIFGKEMATLVDEYKPAGKHEVEFDGNSVPDGVYFCELKAGKFIGTKKIIVLK